MHTVCLTSVKSLNMNTLTSKGEDCITVMQHGKHVGTSELCTAIAISTCVPFSCALYTYQHTKGQKDTQCPFANKAFGQTPFMWT